MKLRGAVILVVLVISIFLPVTGQISVAAGPTEYLVSLDVCDAAGSFMSASADVPSLLECPVSHAPLELVEYIESSDSFFSPSLFSIQIERPPRT